MLGILRIHTNQTPFFALRPNPIPTAPITTTSSLDSYIPVYHRPRAVSTAFFPIDSATSPKQKCEGSQSVTDRMKYVMYPIVKAGCPLERNRRWHGNSTAPTASTMCPFPLQGLAKVRCCQNRVIQYMGKKKDLRPTKKSEQ